MARMEFDHDIVNPEEEKGLDENEEGEGINQPQSGGNKCNQCDYASSRTRNLRTHMKTHSAEKSKKCNQCDYKSSRADVLRGHLKTHNGEKLSKCNQCDYR